MQEYEGNGGISWHELERFQTSVGLPHPGHRHTDSCKLCHTAQTSVGLPHSDHQHTDSCKLYHTIQTIVGLPHPGQQHTDSFKLCHTVQIIVGLPHPDHQHTERLNIIVSWVTRYKLAWDYHTHATNIQGRLYSQPAERKPFLVVSLYEFRWKWSPDKCPEEDGCQWYPDGARSWSQEHGSAKPFISLRVRPLRAGTLYRQQSSCETTSCGAAGYTALGSCVWRRRLCVYAEFVGFIYPLQKVA